MKKKAELCYMNIPDTYPIIPTKLERFCDAGNLAVGFCFLNKSTLFVSNNPVEVLDSLQIIINLSNSAHLQKPENYLVYEQCTATIMGGMVRPVDDIVIGLAPNFDIRVNPTRFHYFIDALHRWDAPSIGNLRYIDNSEHQQMFISNDVRNRLCALNLNQFAAQAEACLYRLDVVLARALDQGHTGLRKPTQ